MSEIDRELEDLCAWAVQIKGIKQIDIADLVAFIPEYEQWLQENSKVWTITRVTCDLCGQEWVAVHHIKANKLECPNCNNMTIY